MAETISITRTLVERDDDGNAISGTDKQLAGTFTVEWPTQRDEQYERFFEDEAAMWENELRGLQTKVKQAAGSYLLSNEGSDGLQEYMDAYTISTRSHGGGRKKEIKVTDAALAEAGVSMEQMQNLAAILGLKVVEKAEEAEEA